MLSLVSKGGEAGRDVREEGGGGRGDYLCFDQHQHGAGEAAGQRRGERCGVFLHSTRRGGSSLALYANQQDPSAAKSHDHTRGGWGLHSADPAERAGLCQLSDDVMIYFEEVMSGLCSERNGVSLAGWLRVVRCQDPTRPPRRGARAHSKVPLSHRAVED